MVPDRLAAANDHPEPTRAIMAAQKVTMSQLQTTADLLAQRPPTAPLAVRLQELQERLTTGRFHLAVLGQFKRGKSTLLNALLGDSFLPTAVVPLTAIPTLIAHGPVREVQVVFQDGRVTTVPPSTLAQYVTETANPGNILGVARVEVRHPAHLLAQGVVLIDTPGIGSTLTYNTETTLDFLAEVDAALFLLSADPPITAVEVEFLKAVQQRVNHIFFLLNKVDYLLPTEQAQALAFLDAILRQQVHLDGDLTLFPVSARLALAARQQGDATGWQTSGLAAVEEHLSHFLNREKQAALEQAITDKTVDTLRESLQLLQTERQALTMPLDELQQKRHAFQKSLTAARDQRRQSADLLQAAQGRMAAHINQQAALLRQEAETCFYTIVETAVTSALNLDSIEQDVQEQLADAAESFFTAHYPPFSQHIQAQVTALFTTYARQADALVNDLRHLAADLFVFEFVPLNPDEPPTRLQTPYWSRSILTGGMGTALSSGWWERLLPPARRISRILNRLQSLAAQLALRNTERLRWAVVQNTQQVMRQFQSHLDARWQETIEATALVLETAVAQRQQQAAGSAAALSDLDQLIDTVHALADELSGP